MWEGGILTGFYSILKYLQKTATITIRINCDCDHNDIIDSISHASKIS